VPAPALRGGPFRGPGLRGGPFRGAGLRGGPFRGAGLLRWAPVAAWMAVLFAVSHVSAPPGIALFPDWTTHGAAYAVLGALCRRALQGRAHALLLAVLLSTAYGASDEYHQSFVPGRHADPLDVAKDLGGSLIGASLYGAWLMRAARQPA
jgi:hypothetical protein